MVAGMVMAIGFLFRGGRASRSAAFTQADPAGAEKESLAAPGPPGTMVAAWPGSSGRAGKEHPPGGGPGPPGGCLGNARSLRVPLVAYASRFRKATAPATMAITA